MASGSKPGTVIATSPESFTVGSSTTKVPTGRSIHPDGVRMRHHTRSRVPDLPSSHDCAVVGTMLGSVNAKSADHAWAWSPSKSTRTPSQGTSPRCCPVVVTASTR